MTMEELDKVKLQPRKCQFPNCSIIVSQIIRGMNLCMYHAIETQEHVHQANAEKLDEIDRLGGNEKELLRKKLTIPNRGKIT